MDVQIKTRNVRLTNGLQSYIQSRIQKLERIHEPVTEATLELLSEHRRSGGDLMVAQFTIVTKKGILRTEEKNLEVGAAADQAIDRMERQIRRFHDKRVYARRRKQQITAANPPELTFPDGQVDSPQDIATLEDEDEDQAMPIVRRKRFKVLPMDEEEAVEQMELLGHDFFVFFNADDEALNVLYRRRDGQYGLIQPELA